jgi:putative hemolysin
MLPNCSMEALISKQALAHAIGWNQKNPILNLIHKLGKFEEINQLYYNTTKSNQDSFIETLFQQLNIQVEVPENHLEKIPTEGPCIIVANHPFGALDGLTMIKTISKHRPDVKIMANFILQQVEPLSDFFIAVNPFENSDIRKNKSGLRNCIAHLQNQGCLVIFPAGEVSTFEKRSLTSIADRKWQNSAIKLILKSKVPVVPVCFEGSNSFLFHFLGKINPQLRTLALPSELLKKKNHAVKIKIGKPISPEQLSFSENPDIIGRYLRAKVYSLVSEVKVKKRFFGQPQLFPKKDKEVAAQESSQVLQTEILSIQENIVLQKAQFTVYLTKANKIPHLLNEIGRCREISFREVGEGSGLSRDLDEFDLYYYHLILWDHENHQLAGAYRIGVGNEILSYYGKKGFYLNTLFKFKSDFIPYLLKSVELGRSFVRPDYQKQRWPLLLLWQGIMLAVKNFSEVQYILGPVTLSNDYTKVSQKLIIQFLQKSYGDEQLSLAIAPRNKVKLSRVKADTDSLLMPIEKEMKKLDALISEIEPQGKRLPVLYKKYLTQNAKILGFNRDPAFKNAVDALMLLDMQNIPDDSLIQ